MFRYASRLYTSLYRGRVILTLAIYGALTSIAYLFAYLLRFEFDWPEEYSAVVLVTLPLLVGIRLVCNRIFRLSSERWRFVGTRDVVRLVLATTIGTALFFAASWLMPLTPKVPRSVILIEWLLSVYLIAGLWIAYRISVERARHLRWRAQTKNVKRVLILGAGEAGAMIAREMCRYPTGYLPVGFADDDVARWGTTLHGFPVLGGTDDVPAMAHGEDVDEIIIAIPSATPEALRRIVERCENANLPFKVLPGIAEVLNGNFGLDQLREVRIEDLLGREPVKLELPELSADLGDQCVLITGAAGSIGSELARQVALHKPARLVLLDQAETELYYTELELRARFPDVEVVPVIGDIVDRWTVERIFIQWSPNHVFHAAAYKHVPVMEANVREAVRNNVIGTWRMTEIAGRYGADKFILVSTDKAVRPTSTMGATKRLAELIVLDAQQRHPGTMYGAVRFGNVLGSRGSVVPIFHQQIREGKPLTVTHPDATRYFMTIPEAVQLILQASLLASLRGHVAMLDMGEPVRIVDLARNLLRLSGRAVTNGSIVFTGLRKGEKLHEELAGPDEDTVPTLIPKVRIVSGPAAAERLVAELPRWEAALEQGHDEQVIAAMCALFPELQIGDEFRPLVELVASKGSA